MKPDEAHVGTDEQLKELESRIAMFDPHVSEDVRRIAAELLSALFRDYLTDRLRLPEAVQGKEGQNHE